MAIDNDEQKWYLADVIVRAEHPETGNNNPNTRRLTWINTLLIRSVSPEDAYDKAIRIATDRYPQTYKAAAGNMVQWVVLGISSLREVEEELQDGSEIDWSSRGLISFKRAESLVKTKQQLLDE